MSVSKFEKTTSRHTASSPMDGVEAPLEAPLETPARERPEAMGGPPRGPQRFRVAKWLPLFLVGLLLLGGLFWRSRQNAGGAGGRGAPGGRAARAAEAQAVKIVPVALGTITQTLEVTGSLKSNQNIDLGSKISGRVARVYVDEGSRVRRGQLLIALDDADLRAQVAQAQAGVRAAQVRLNQTIVGLPAREQQVGTSIQQAEATLQSAQARYRQALLNEPAQVTTAESQVSTARQTVRTAAARVRQARQTARQTELQAEAEVKRAQAGVSSAQAGVAAARARLAEVQRGARDQQIASAQAQVRLAEAQLRDADTELNRARRLFAGGAAPRSLVDTAQTRYDVNQAQLESARQNLSLVREGATNEQVRQAEEAVRQAQQSVPQAEAVLAQAQAGRARTLVAQGEVTTALAALSQAQSGLQTAQANMAQIPITQQETRVAQEAVGQARAGLLQARANRSQIPVARSDVQAARAAVQQAQAQLRQAQVSLAYARITSPVNGVVNQKLTDEGETASPGAVLLNLVSLDRVYFEAQVGENSVGRVRVGQPANINVPAVSDRPLRGFVSDIIPTADTRLRQFRVRITLPAAPRQLTPGAFARGTLTTQSVRDTLLVPSDAVQQSNGRPTLLLAMGPPDNAQVKRRTVAVGIAAGGKTQIIGGVERGDRVILGNETLEDGDKVRVAKTS